MRSDCTIIIFAKAPIAGTVKTRLAPALGEHGAAKLYQHMLRHALTESRAARLGPVELWCAPDITHDFFVACAAEFCVTLHQQQSGDVGERMAHALQHTLAHTSCALLIGSDCPAMNAAYLQQAANKLEQTQVVIGPVADGGYALVGAAHRVPPIFNRVDWSTAQVMAQTRARLHTAALDYAELPILWDVDTPDDLEKLAALPGFAELMQTAEAAD